MPRVPADYIPAYRHHKSSGQAIVTLCARDHLLGPFGSAASRVRYHELIAQWLAGGRQPIGAAVPRPATTFDPPATTIATLIAAHARHARTYYVDGDGRPTTEVATFAAATRPLLDLFAPLPAADFTPTCMRTVRDRMVAKRWARTLINRQTNRLRSIWKWASSEELVDVRVYHTLATLAPLKRGRSAAVESEPTRPVCDAHVEATLSHLAPPVAALVELQRLTGSRGGELFTLRAVDLDTSGPVWTYSPPRHKTAHFGHQRTIYFGPRAQATLAPFMASRPIHAFLFSPREGNAARKAASATKGKPRRLNQRPNVRETERSMREHYHRESYRRAIARASDSADAAARDAAEKSGSPVPDDLRIIPRWHPHQLRHTAATRWRKDYGPEAALTLLGDKTTRMIDVYAEKDAGTARRIAAEIG